MKFVLIVILAFSSVFAFDNSDEFINEINRKQNFWKAGRNFHKDTPTSYLSGLFGAKLLPEDIRETIPVIKHEVDGSIEIPETFDARTHWPQCKTIKEIADQSACGSCWAVSVASVISDRICIHSDGKFQPHVSARELITCENRFSSGCQGGWPFTAFDYWRTDGLVTGGPYGSNIGCQPYPFAPCEHYNVDGRKPKCPLICYDPPKCVKTCDNSTIKFEKDLTYGEKPYIVDKNEQNIQLEILMNGPVVAIFTAYNDFLYYKSGVYVQTSKKYEGGHAVRVLGWGIENGTKYWLVANSWNEDWGEKGLFKIRRGTNECGLESQMITALPKQKNFY